jgi:DNA-binding PadR family transcriptional regulator
MWTLDTISGIGKTSSIQIALLIEFAVAGEENPVKIPNIIADLEKFFEGLWIPKKGTIYPAVHNLHIRGYLKRHHVKPYGYSITKNGLQAIEKIVENINQQLDVYFTYFAFVLENLVTIDKEQVEIILTKYHQSMKEIQERMNLLLEY